METGEIDGPASSRVAALHPAWFASVMGTSVLAVSAAGSLPGPAVLGDVLAVVLLLLATLLALGFGIAVSRRWLEHRDAALGDLRNPLPGPLLGTVPGGLLVLSAAWSAAGPILVPEAASGTIAWVLLGVGAPLAVVLGVLWAVEVIHAAPIGLEKVTGTWFLPPVVLVLIPLASTPLTREPAMLALGYAAAGAGLLLFVLIAGLVVARLALAGSPPPPMAPAVWIAIAPPSAGGVALLGMAGATASPSVLDVTIVVATGMWGFAAWWVLLAIVVLRRQRRAGPIPWTPAWWGFTFPLGALAALSLKMGEVWGSTALDVLGVVVYGAALGVWALVAARTLGAVRDGSAWRR